MNVAFFHELHFGGARRVVVEYGKVFSKYHKIDLYYVDRQNEKDLEKIYNDDQRTEDLELIVEEANRCKNIVANLLNFARQGKLHLKQFDLIEMVKEVLKPFTVNPVYRQIVFRIDVQENNYLMTGDEDQIKQVFVNVIKNACDAMSESSTKELIVNLFSDAQNFKIPKFAEQIIKL